MVPPRVYLQGLRTSAVDLSQRIHDVQQRGSAAEIVYQSHPLWPLPPVSSLVGTLTGAGKGAVDNTPTKLRLSVLDSSFNPPTLAHLALAQSTPTSNDVAIESDYDAHLLLLSVRNADKAIKPGDASYTQRLEMMILLAHELQERTDPSKHGIDNIAVAILDEPTFVRKSAVLRQFLQARILSLCKSPGASSAACDPTPPQPEAPSKPIELTFVMGFDTLERFFAPRYYGDSLAEMHAALKRFFAPHPDGEGSAVLCAWRGENRPEYAFPVEGRPAALALDGAESAKPEKDSQVSAIQSKMQETLTLARPFVEAGNVLFTELSEHEMSLSSSEVRVEKAKETDEWLRMVPTKVAEFIKKESLYRQ